jgi:hypothetical protein
LCRNTYLGFVIHFHLKTNTRLRTVWLFALLCQAELVLKLSELVWIFFGRKRIYKMCPCPCYIHQMVLFQKTRRLVKKVHNAMHYRESSVSDDEFECLASPVGSFEVKSVTRDTPSNDYYCKDMVKCIPPSYDLDHPNYTNLNTPPLTPTTPSYTLALTTHTVSSTSLPSIAPLVSSQVVDDNFPVQDYTKWEAQYGHSVCQDCLVCTRPFCRGDQIRELPCSSTLPHIFHSSCLFDWLTQSHLSCPTCDREVL